VLEVGEHEGRPRDPADLAGIDGEVLEGAPPSDEQAKPRSPRHRSDRRSVLRVRMLMSSSAPSASRTAANGSSLLRTRTELILITPANRAVRQLQPARFTGPQMDRGQYDACVAEGTALLASADADRAVLIWALPAWLVGPA